MPTIETLPAPEAITSKPIATAAQALRVAMKTQDEARKTRVQLEIELPNAKDADASADEKLRAEGKPPLKGRPATAAAEKAIADAQHEELVTTKATDRARGDLQAAAEEHGSAYATERAKRVENAAQAFQTTLAQLVKDYGEYGAATRVALQLDDETIGVGTVQLDVKREMEGIEIPSGAQPVGTVHVAELLAKLAALGTPHADIKAPRLGMTDEAAAQLGRKGSKSQWDGNADLPAVQRERAEREAEAERLNREYGEQIIAGRA
jgi:hypothetical protein